MRDHEIAKKREDCLEYINGRGGGQKINYKELQYTEI
jgi:hypothetical protein